MFSKRAITLVGILCSLGLASGAGAQSWSDKLKDAATAEDVKTEGQEPADASAEKAEDADVAAGPPAVANDDMNKLQDAATAGAATGSDAVAKGADVGSAAKQGGAAAINKYMGSTDAGEAKVVPSGAAAEQAGEQEAPKE